MTSEMVGVILFYVLVSGGVGVAIYRDYHQRGFSFHFVFSLVYWVTLFGGFPLSVMLAEYGVTLPDWQTQYLFLSLATVAYGAYAVCYHLVSSPNLSSKGALSLSSNSDAKLTGYLLLGVSVGALLYFLLLNGWLLFKLEKYSEIFSLKVQAVALKRFFYFALPALLIFFFLNENRKAWWAFLFAGVAFGVASYLAVGGTRANLALAVMLFCLLGLYKGYLSYRLLLGIAGLVVVAMFGLALARYKLQLANSDLFFTFLYMTRDTFSPWQNVAMLLDREFEFLGLMPIIRDFYVYLPEWLWADKPDRVVNTANYLTWEILGNGSGLATSPTILGAFYIMAGVPMMILGSGLVGVMLAGVDRLFKLGQQRQSALLQAFCFGQLFNLIVLVREGADAFISRAVFFTGIFVICWLIARSIRIGKS